MVTRQSGTVNHQFRLLFGAGSATGLDDGQLLERFVDRRDEAAFAALLARYGPLVLGVCRRSWTTPLTSRTPFRPPSSCCSRRQTS